MKQILLSTTFFLIVLSFTVSAQPSISSVSGNIVHDNSITLSGTGFGTKVQGAPLLWDDFEDGTPGQDLQGWLFETIGNEPNNVNPIYSNEILRVNDPNINQLSGLMHTPGSQYTCAAYKRLGTRPHEVYASYNWYIDHVSGVNSWNIKMLRILPGSPIFKSGTPSISTTLGLNTFGYYSQSGTEDWWWGLSWNENTWYRHEYHVRASEPPGTANGICALWIDGNLFHSFTNDIVMETGATIDAHGEYYYYDNVILPFFVANAECSNCPVTGNEYKIFYDNLYVDDTLARIELCSGSNWNNKDYCELQIPQTWSSDSITFTANQGTFQNGETAYLYVVDENGDVSENGYPVVVGGTPICGDAVCSVGEVCSADCATETHCSDGVDNDEDSDIDGADSDCITSTCTLTNAYWLTV